jgi:hypothetical protein
MMVAVLQSREEFATEVFSKDQCQAQKSPAKARPGSQSQA